MSTYSQDGFTPDPSTPVYEDISLDATNGQASGTSTQSGGKTDTAKQEAAGVAQDATQAGKQVAAPRPSRASRSPARRRSRPRR